jgi:signal transduction histidine kinase
MELAHYELGSTEVIDPAFLEITAQQATLLLRGRGSAFYLYDPAQGQIKLVAMHNVPQIPWDPDLPKRVAELGRFVMEVGPGCLAVLAVPSCWRDAVRGVLIVCDDASDRVFGEQDVSQLQPLADLTAAVLHQADRLTRMTAQFRALHVIDIALTSSLQLDRVLNLILEKAVGLVGAQHGSLRLLNSETGELVLKAALGEGWTAQVRAYTFPIGHGITGWVAKHRQPYLCPDAHRDSQNIVLFENMRSGVAVPLLFGPEEGAEQEELLGVLLLESTRPDAFERQDVELLEALAQEAVIAIQNATQHQKLQVMHQTLQDEQERRVAAEKWTVMGQAATALAHRINNLMGLVPASAGEIRRTLADIQMSEADRAWIEANLDRIERNGRFILRLSNALFRPFQEPGPPVRFDANRLLNEALQAANLPPSIEVIRDYGDDLLPVESSSLLVDIFLELITNARKAMEGQPRQYLNIRSRLEVDETGAWIIVEVGDTGRGILPDQMAHLWDMFQASAEGLGFGLWWVRTFIERQGGTMACDTRPGEGTTFSVRLPACTGPELSPS